jgi:flagellar motor switch protein FliN
MADTPETIGQDEVARVLAEAPSVPADAVDQGSIDSLLDQAQTALSSIDAPATSLPEGVKPFAFKDLSGTSADNETASLDLLRDVQLDLKIELGRTQMQLEDVLRLKQGAVVTLDKLAGDPVDVYANGRLIARGEVLVLNDNFCVRVAELIAGDDAV